MNNENNTGGLDDISYIAPPKKSGPTGVSAPVLDDIEYVAPSAKKGGPTGVSAPVLDDMGDYVPPVSAKKGAPTGVSVPVLDDDNTPYQAEKEDVLIMTDEEIIAKFTPEQLESFNRFPEANKQSVLDSIRKQFGAVAPPVKVTAPVLDEDNYTPPPKKQEKPPEPPKPVTAPVLDDEPAPTTYKPKFVDEDLERAKKEAAVKAVSSQLVSDQKDSKESLRMMLELKEERRRELAAKGFKVCIVLGIVGVVAAAAFFLLYSGSLGLTYKDGISNIANILKESSLYIAAAMAVSSLALMSGFGFVKSIATLVYVVSAIAQIFPGIVMIPQHNGSLPLTVVLYIVSLAGTIGVIFGMSGIEAVSLYFKREMH
ncbi:MAG: ABC transporter permease [Ruminococcus sp.]|nr:ABC transporter permease [Ruminococcus sp.]